MAKSLEQWIKEDVEPVSKKPISWLSSNFFFRDPIRGVFVDSDFFFSPADGIILYQRQVKANLPLLNIKGAPYSLQSALFDKSFVQECLVIGIFMTFYDPHINRVPYSGRLRFKKLENISSHNQPMLEIEQSIITKRRIGKPSGYLFHNERVLNSIFSPELETDYFILQIADFDVDCICHFNNEQNRSVMQSERFGMIRYGSQVDLIIPISKDYKLSLLQKASTHVEAGVDPLVRVS